MIIDVKGVNDGLQPRHIRNGGIAAPGIAQRKMGTMIGWGLSAYPAQLRLRNES